MWTKIAKWGVIIALIFGVGYACYNWGYSSSQEDAAEERQEAVEKAIKNQQQKYQKELAQVKKQAEQYQKRLKEANKTLDKKDEKIGDLKDGEKECFSKESLRLFNQY